MLLDLLLTWTTDNVEPSTILNALLWKEVSRIPDLRPRIHAASFDHPKQRLSLDTEVGKITTEPSGKRVVTLVFHA
jgi:hypothetical protein